MNDNQDESEIRAIEREIKRLSAEKLLNKKEAFNFYLDKTNEMSDAEYNDMPLSFNSEFFEETLKGMPENAFCQIKEVLSCARITQDKSCVCVTKLLFGAEVEACSMEVFDKVKGPCTPKALKMHIECMMVTRLECHSKAEEMCSPIEEKLSTCEARIGTIKDILRGNKKHLAG